MSCVDAPNKKFLNDPLKNENKSTWSKLGSFSASLTEHWQEQGNTPLPVLFHKTIVCQIAKADKCIKAGD